MGRAATKMIKPVKATMDTLTSSVFSSKRTMIVPTLKLPKGLQFNKKLKMDGLIFLNKLPDKTIPVAFFDPQYRGILDKLQYGNEGKKRGKKRCLLEQMTAKTISEFIIQIDRVLIPSGHLFLWIDKFHLCQGFKEWFADTQLQVVDMVSWDKGRLGMGYRTRRVTEYCIILQKRPTRAKGVWTIHNIPDTWQEKVVKNDKKHPHPKPIDLQSELIAAVTNEGDIVIDPAAGSFSVLESAIVRNRNFLGCDLNG